MEIKEKYITLSSGRRRGIFFKPFEFKIAWDTTEQEYVLSNWGFGKEIFSIEVCEDMLRVLKKHNQLNNKREVKQNGH